MFYSADAATLENSVREASAAELEPSTARAIFVPHAGYMYSGRVAGMTWGSVQIPEVVVVVAVNHYGLGASVATSSARWQTPLGVVEPDRELVSALRQLAPFVQDDPFHQLTRKAQEFIAEIEGEES